MLLAEQLLHIHALRLEHLVDVIIVMLLEPQRIFCDWCKLACLLPAHLVFMLNLELFENPKEPFKVNASLVVFPELVHEESQVPLIHFQFGACEQVSEVLASDEASA